MLPAQTGGWVRFTEGGVGGGLTSIYRMDTNTQGPAAEGRVASAKPGERVPSGRCVRLDAA